MSLIPRSKFGDCVECGDKDVNCVKVGKSLYCINCNNSNKQKKYIERASLKNKVKSVFDSERKSLIDDLDSTFSRYIRIKESNSKGFVECYTCGRKDHWKYLQCGHYIRRSETLLRWDSRNAKTQCIECNCNLHGNMEEYTKRLNEEYPGLPEQLKEQSREVHKYSREDLKEILIDIRAKLRLVESKLE